MNPEGEIKVVETHDLGIGRSAKELVRKVQAAQYIATHDGEVCPFVLIGVFVIFNLGDIDLKS